jgi:hypothetical protein
MKRDPARQGEEAIPRTHFPRRPQFRNLPVTVSLVSGFDEMDRSAGGFPSAFKRLEPAFDGGFHVSTPKAMYSSSLSVSSTKRCWATCGKGANPVCLCSSFNRLSDRMT